MSVSWFQANHQIVQSKDDVISIIYKDGSTGSAIDVSAWVCYYDVNDTVKSGTIAYTSAGGDITLTDSGTGTTDTVNINLAAAETGLAIGTYSHELTATISGSDISLMRGKITFLDEYSPAS